LGPGIEQALGAAGDAALVAERLAAALDRGEGAGGPEEVAWAARRLFETLAAERPLVVCFDDVHWAEPTLVALIEHVAGPAGGGPIVLLVLARPELADRPLAGRDGGANALSLSLPPLGSRDSAALIDELAREPELAPGVRHPVA